MQIPENITKHHGIEASALGQVGADEPAVYCGLDSWRPLIGAALLLLRHTDENVVRIMTGTHTILVMRNAERQAVADNNEAEACFCGIAALAKGTGAP